MSRKEDLQTREYCFEILLPVLRGEEYSHVYLKAVLDKNDDWEPGRKAFLKKLTMGVLERKTTLDYCLQRFLKQPFVRMKTPLRIILEIGAYQILYMDHVYDTKACDLSVELAKKKGFGQMTGLVNGVLRNLVRSKESIEFPEKDHPAEYLSVRYSVPEWMTKFFLSQYDFERVERMCESFTKESRIGIHLKSSLPLPEKESILTFLKENSAEFEKCTFLPDACSLKGAGEITALPGFEEGKFYIQDYSSQTLGYLVPLKEGDTVLDACAAPGGKSIYLADKLAGSGLVISCDVSENKTGIIRENVSRMGFENVKVRLRDATADVPEKEEKADVVLCDVPCSGLGVMGRKPDIKYRVTAPDLNSLVLLQKEIVTKQVHALKTGGIFVYSTCTVNKAENEGMAAWIKENLPLCEIPFPNLPDELTDCRISEGMLQFLPGEHGCDGFFIAMFRKK